MLIFFDFLFFFYVKMYLKLINAFIYCYVDFIV